MSDWRIRFNDSFHHRMMRMRLPSPNLLVFERLGRSLVHAWGVRYDIIHLRLDGSLPVFDFRMSPMGQHTSG